MINGMNNIRQRESLIRSLGVFELRGLARELGVPSPTTKKREELLSLIFDKMKEGNSLDLNVQKRGRPFKKLTSINEIVSNMLPDNSEKSSNYDSVVYFMQEEKPISAISEDLQVFEGIVKQEKEGYSIVDINKNVKVFIDIDFDNFELLRLGMFIKVQAAKVSGTEVFLATKLEEIDGESLSCYKPLFFEKGEEIISNDNLPFASGFAKEGRRNVYCYSEDLYENNHFETLYNFCLENDYKMLVLNVDSSYENQIMFKKLGVKSNFSTQYGEKSYWSLHKVIDVINHVHYLIEQGKKIVVFIPDILTSLRKLDENFTEEEMLYGYKQQSIFIIQKLLALGRAYQNSCSCTIIMGYNELDKDDKFLNNDIIRISKKI